MSDHLVFTGPNAAYLIEQYERYQKDPASVGEDLARFFAEGNVAGRLGQPARQEAGPVSGADVGKVVAAARLARSIREYGHLAAAIDPLGGTPPGDPALEPEAHGLSEDDLKALPASIVWGEVTGQGTCLEAIRRLRALYTGAMGYDFSHVHNYDERAWLKEAVEGAKSFAPSTNEARRGLLERLGEVEAFERYIHQTFPGQKRFSVEGVDVLIPMLDVLIEEAVREGARSIVIGMAHRGRLNVLAHVLKKPIGAIFSEFRHAPDKAEADTSIGWSGDVKYHLGGHRTIEEDGHVAVQLTLANNPSHLEFVNPVTEGLARAAQERRDQAGSPPQDPKVALAILIHGDAAFVGEGVSAETLNLSRLPAYQTGGTVHIILNNQLGFTTTPSEDRSTLYASDLSKGFEIPIIHVNADDPEAAFAAVRIARAYRDAFGKDFLIDLVGYRRWGHNEGDEPAFTQPVMYSIINRHPTVRALYGDRLVEAGVVSRADVDGLFEMAQRSQREADTAWQAQPRPEREEATLREVPAKTDTSVSAKRLAALNDALLERPAGFHPNPKLERLLTRRREALHKEGGIDWAHGEALAFASLLEDGVPIRMAGQDTERGTFSQRHLVLHDVEDGRTYTPHQHLPTAHAAFTVANSPLSEVAALGFEYGYSVEARETLVIWEAQFGDFANSAQVMIDQFVAAARAKWRETSGLVLLLPHGYEGQGPEHSSARLERFLQLVAEENMTVAYPTSAAQYFHLLRRQALLLPTRPRPLVVMSPKSLLRHPLAGSSLSDLTDGSFEPVQGGIGGKDPTSVERLLLMSGKIAVDLMGAKVEEEQTKRLAMARLEELYPFPQRQIRALLGRYNHLKEVVWVQEEPENMGAWTYVRGCLGAMLGDLPLRYVGRPPRAATAEGDADVHQAEEAHIIGEALAVGNPVGIRGGVRNGR